VDLDKCKRFITTYFSNSELYIKLKTHILKKLQYWKLLSMKIINTYKIYCKYCEYHNNKKEKKRKENNPQSWKTLKLNQKQPEKKFLLIGNLRF
jgi:hypothetical protein